MSGIAGIVRRDARPVLLADVERMTAAIVSRGPDDRGHWQGPSLALGHVLLRATEEAADERKPLLSADGSLVLVFDGMLHECEELRGALGARGVRLRARADSELVLAAFEAWGLAALQRLHGLFAFALWDGRRRELVCARDRTGQRPFLFHYSDALGFCFASGIEALLAIPGMPRRLNEGRVADLIAGGLEGFDDTSTFFWDISRLPAAHVLRFGERGLTIDRYWEFAPPSLLRLRSDRDYEEAFRATLLGSVDRAMRGSPTLGAMLSGGLDSGAVAAVAGRLKAEKAEAPLKTFSAIGEDPACIETACIRASAALRGLEPHFIEAVSVASDAPDLVELLFHPADPFDRNMSLIRAVYRAGRSAGVRAMLDGMAGDLVLASGDAVAHFIRRGKFATAWSEIQGQSRYWNANGSAAGFMRALARSSAPPRVRRLLRGGPHRVRFREALRHSLINDGFARACDLAQRYAELDARTRDDSPPGSVQARTRSLFRPRVVAARERYEREAARYGIEPRDPYLDLQMITFGLSLPVEQLVRNGYPKSVLRRAMVGEMPDIVLQRTGRKHLGATFTRTLMAAALGRTDRAFGHVGRLEQVMDMGRLHKLLGDCRDGRPLTSVDLEQLLTAHVLSLWMERHACG